MSANPPERSSRHFISTLVGNGLPLLSLVGLGLSASGAFALFLSATGSFLPHDVAWLGMEAKDLCARNLCPVVHFMFHDRAAFGGVLLSIGILYLWLTTFPLRQGEPWAWWTMLLSGTAGFASFLCYLGYGYLDYWHAVGTLILLFIYAWGLSLSWQVLQGNRSITSLRQSAVPWDFRSRSSRGRALLIFIAAGQIAAGVVIMTVGMTQVFVPQDLVFMGLNREDLLGVSPRLIPLIAHDRAGFGGSLVSSGIVVGLIVWKARPAPHLWEALLFSGSTGFICAIGVHYMIGYVDFVHVAPALLGAFIFLAGILLSYRPMYHHEGKK